MSAHDTHALMLFEAHKKSVGLAYALWFFLGAIGAHRFYAAKPWSGIFMMFLFLFGLVTFRDGGIFLIGLDGIFVLADAFSIPSWITAYNTELVTKFSKPIAAP